ncbi:hypothetical protein [Thiomonas sp.]
MTPQQGNAILQIPAGESTGRRVFDTGFTPTTVIVYNTTQGTLYLYQGSSSNEQPLSSARTIPPGAYLPLRFSQSLQSFTMWWKFDTAPASALQVVIDWTTETLSMAGVVPQVTGNMTFTNSTIDVGTVGSITSGTVTFTNTKIDVGTVGTITGGTVTFTNTKIDVGTVGTITGGTVTFTNTKIDVGTVGTITGNVTVEFPAAQDVVLNDNAPITLAAQDVQVGTTNLAIGPPLDITLAIAAAGDSQTATLTCGAGFTGHYDGFYLRINSPSNQVPNLKIVVNGVGLGEYGLLTAALDTAITWRTYNNTIGFSNVIPIDPSAVFDQIDVTITNTAQADTETLTFQVYGRFASSVVVNPSSDPAQMQPASGSFDTSVGFNVTFQPGVSGNYSAPITLVNSGSYIVELWLYINNGSGDAISVDLQNGTSTDYTSTLGYALSAGQVMNTFKAASWVDGVSNLGIVVAAATFASTANDINIAGYAVLRSSTPRPQTSLIA